MIKVAYRNIYTYPLKWKLVKDKGGKYDSIQYQDKTKPKLDEVHYFKYLDNREVYFRISKKEFDSIKPENDDCIDVIYYGKHPQYYKEIYYLNSDFDCEVDILVDKKKFSNFKRIDENNTYIYLYNKNTYEVVKAFKNTNPQYTYLPYVVYELDTAEYDKYQHFIKEIEKSNQSTSTK